MTFRKLSLVPYSVDWFSLYLQMSCIYFHFID